MVLQEFLGPFTTPADDDSSPSELEWAYKSLAHLQRKNAAAEHIACCSPPVFFVATITRRRRPF